MSAQGLPNQHSYNIRLVTHIQNKMYTPQENTQLRSIHKCGSLSMMPKTYGHRWIMPIPTNTKRLIRPPWTTWFSTIHAVKTTMYWIPNKSFSRSGYRLNTLTVTKIPTLERPSVASNDIGRSGTRILFSWTWNEHRKKASPVPVEKNEWLC